MTNNPASSASDDLIWRAYIDDLTGQFFDNFDARLRGIESTARNGFSQVDQHVAQSSKQMGLMAGIVGGLTAKFVELAERGAQGLYGLVKQSIDARARVDTLAVSLGVVGGNAGYSKEEIDGYVESVVKMGITHKQANENLLRMAQSEIDLSKASDLARTSQDAAVIAGINSSDAFGRILHGITTLQPEIFRNIGLTIDLEGAYRKFADQAGKGVTALTLTEKRQAALNAVMEAGKNIAGTYEAAMGSVGKILGSLDRYHEEIQYSLGEMFQPSYLALVEEYKNLLSDVLNFLKDNSDEIEKWSYIAGDAITITLDLMKELVGLLAELGASAITAGEDFAYLVEDVLGVALPESTQTGTITVEGFAERVTDLEYSVTSLMKAMVLAKATFAGAGAVLEIGWKKALLLIEASRNALEGNREANAEIMEQMKALSGEAGGNPYQDAYNKSMQESIDKHPELISGYNDAAIAARSAASETNNYAEIMATKLSQALETASSRLKKLREEMEEEKAERALDARRSAIEEELKMQWQREDREKAHQERINSILEGYEESKTQIIKQAGEARVQIEEDYRKRLQEIQEEFEFNASELARRRDAVGMLALIRQNKRQVDKEREAYEERKKKAEESFQSTIKQLDENLQKQLQKAEEARQKELDNVEKQLAREKQLKELHNQWAEEDRATETQKRLQAIIDEFMALDGATQAGLAQLIADWDWYFTTLTNMSSGRINPQAGIDAGASSADQLKQVEKQIGQDLNGDGVIGQAGQISQMLSPSFMNPSGMVPPLPSVNPRGGGSSTKEIKLSGDVSGLDPYIQRVLVNALLEIERNNG